MTAALLTFETIDLSRLGITHHGGGPDDGDRQVRPGALHQALGFVLGLFVGVAEALTLLELVFGDHPHAIARHVAGAEVHQALQLRALARQLEHRARAVDVHLARDVTRHAQVADGREVEDVRRLFDQALVLGPREAQVHVDDVAFDHLDRRALELARVVLRFLDELGLHQQGDVAAGVHLREVLDQPLADEAWVPGDEGMEAHGAAP